MNLLPWLLDWPPRPGAVGAVLLRTVFSVGTLVVFGGATAELASENVTVESVDLPVRLNDEDGLPDVGNGTVATCLGVGTPGDSISVTGDVTVDVPAGGRNDRRGERLLVDVNLDRTEAHTTRPVEGTGRVTASVLWLLDEETLSVGDTARLRVRVRAGGKTVASVERAVTVENGSRSYDCDRSLHAPPR